MNASRLAKTAAVTALAFGIVLLAPTTAGADSPQQSSATAYTGGSSADTGQQAITTDAFRPQP